MHDIARRSPALAGLKPLDPGLSAEVLEWASELRVIWSATGLSMNEFASLHPIDKGTISRYLNGQRVPRDRWFLDKLLAIQADNGQPLTPAVREHLTGLHLRALAIAHPHEYRVRLVSDELEMALTGKLEAERHARALEEQLAERNRQVQELAADKGRLRAAWDADHVAMQAELERLTREIDEITGQLDLARERAAQAKQRCQQLENLLDHLDATQETSLAEHSPTAPERFADPAFMRQLMHRDIFTRIGRDLSAGTGPDLSAGTGPDLSARLSPDISGGRQGSDAWGIDHLARELVARLVPHFCNAGDLLLVQSLADDGELPVQDPDGSLPLRRITLLHDRKDPVWQAAFPAGEILYCPTRSPHRRCMDTGMPVLERAISENQASEIARAWRHQPIAELLSGASMLTLPLIARGAMLGFFACTRQEGFRPFNTYDIELGMDFAARAAVYIARATEKPSRT
jgi:hypothetical protein